MANAAEKKNRSFLSNFESFREFLKINFYYSSLSSSQISELMKDIKDSKYSSYKNIVNALSKGKFQSQKYNGKNALKYDIDQFESNYNSLADAFFLKSLTAYENNITIQVLIALSAKSMTFDELCGIFDKFLEDGIIVTTLRSKLKNMLEYDLIKKEGSKYSICSNPFADMKEDELLYFVNYIDFMKNNIYPEALGYCMFTLIQRVYEKNTGKTYISPFQFKYSHLANILDDIVLWQLIDAIQANKYVSFSYKSQKASDIIPLRIFTENQYNRIYLFAVNPNDTKREIRVFKLKDITDLKVDKKSYDISKEKKEEYMQYYYDEQKYSFLGKIDTKKGNVKIRLKYKGRGQTMKNKIVQDFACVEFEGKNTAIVTVKNKKILIPWLKANIGQIEALDDELSQIIKDEVTEMKKIYGIIS